MVSCVVYGKCFFIEDNDDVKSDYVQYYMCDILVVQQSGGDCNQNDNIYDCQQQIMEVDWFKVGFGIVVFYLVLVESKVNDGYQYIDDVKCKCGVLVIMCCQLWCCQYREEGVDVDGYIIYCKCVVEMWIVFCVIGRQQGRWVSFKQIVIYSDSCYVYIDDVSVMIRLCDQCIIDSQYYGIQYNNVFGVQNFII